MHSHMLDPDTQVTLLLHARFGSGNTAGPDPLTVTEYNRIARVLQDIGLRPGDLLQDARMQDVLSAENLNLEPDRVTSLLGRGTALALAVEAWTNMGLWVLSRSDERYPRLIKDRLGVKSPPLLFGAGNYRLLNHEGLVIVGSRDVDSSGIDFTKRLAALCGQQQIQVVSGAARGVDKESMLTALSEGGTAVGVTPGILRQAAISRDFRQHISTDSLVLVSPYYPEAPFHPGNAMARNKVVYALGTWAVVVSSATDGGTWTGANENLKNGWVPTYVRWGQSVLEGNSQLIDRGAFPLDEQAVTADVDLATLLEEIRQQAASQVQLDRPESDTRPGEPIIAESFTGIDEIDLIHVVWPRIAGELVTAKTVQDLCVSLNVRHRQMTDWLTTAVEHGLVIRRTKPVRYELVRKPPQSGQLSFLSDST